MSHDDNTPLERAATGSRGSAADETFLPIDRFVFQGLLYAGRPVPLRDVSRLAGTAADAWLVTNRSRISSTAAGAIVGFRGISMDRTPHTIHAGPRTRHVWCAFDALGVMAALRADGKVASTDPETGRRIEIDFCRGRPFHPAAVVFVPRRSKPDECRHVRDWCRHVNFFESDSTALAWAAAKAVEGDLRTLEGVAIEAVESWRSLV